MGRCTICNAHLSVEEDTRKHATTKEELGLCNICLGSINEILPLPIRTDEEPAYWDDEIEGFFDNTGFNHADWEY